MHYSLLVVSDGSKTLDEMMLPFKECYDYDPDNPYIVFEDTEDECRKAYETDFQTMVEIDGQLISKYDDRFRTDDRITYCFKYPDDAKFVDVPHTSVYDTFEKYMEDWCGCQRDAIKHRYGHWENPNGKWDWYRIGGRFYGLIEAKVGGYGRYSHSDFRFSGFFSDSNREPYAKDDTHFDIARACDVISIDANRIHSTLTPDGVWDECEVYFPEGNEEGKHFVDKDGWRDGLWARCVEPYRDCMLMVVDYHI